MQFLGPKNLVRDVSIVLPRIQRATEAHPIRPPFESDTNSARKGGASAFKGDRRKLRSPSLKAQNGRCAGRPQAHNESSDGRILAWMGLVVEQAQNQPKIPGRSTTMIVNTCSSNRHNRSSGPLASVTVAHFDHLDATTVKQRSNAQRDGIGKIPVSWTTVTAIQNLNLHSRLGPKSVGRLSRSSFDARRYSHPSGGVGATTITTSTMLSVMFAIKKYRASWRETVLYRIKHSITSSRRVSIGGFERNTVAESDN